MPHFNRPDFSGGLRDISHYQPPQPVEQPPGLMDILGQSLGEGVNSGIQRQMKKSMLDKMLSNINPNMSAQERLSTVLNADPEDRKYVNEILNQQRDDQQKALISQQADQAFQRSYGNGRQSENMGEAEQDVNMMNAQSPISALNQEKQNILENYRLLSPEQKKDASKRLQEIQKEEKIEAKNLKEAVKEKKKIQGIFDQTATILGKGNLGHWSSGLLHGGALNRERQRDIGKINFLRQNFEGVFRQMVNTGRITNDQYASLMTGLPTADSNDMENLGKLEAIAETLGLDKSKIENIFEKQSAKKQIPQQLSMKKLPSASENQGRRIVNPETGQRLQSDGKNWVQVK